MAINEHVTYETEVSELVIGDDKSRGNNPKRSSAVALLFLQHVREV